MAHQGVVLQGVFFSFYVLLVITSKFAESTVSDRQEIDFKSPTAQDTESRTVPLSTSSIRRTNEILKPSQIRNRRSNVLTDQEQFIDDNPGLDSAFLYSDQIMQNLLNIQSPKPLSYARSNFFLNLLKPRTTRYNAWDDHSLMHFGKRSVEDDNGDKVLVKRSADLWPSESPLDFEGEPSSATKNNHSPQANMDTLLPNAVAEEIRDDTWKDDSGRGPKDYEKSIQEAKELDKKSNDPWHSMMSFGKKSENPWEHNTLHFGKKNDPWHFKMSFGKRSENPWEHSTMHFGKKSDPWHNIMSFGKRSDPWHNMMSFGKRSETSDLTSFDKREDPWHNMMSFGKKSEPWHNMMSFGKRSENPWEHNTLHFGKRDDPWHNMMSFGKKSSDPWHSMMSFGKRSDYPWDHNTLHFGKRDEPWHNIMSFGKRSDYPWDHNTLHFGKRDDPWHNMMSFGKRFDYPWEHNNLHFGKRGDPWHSMMSFGKKSEISDLTEEDKREDPWHNMMSFGKKSDPWHSMMSFGKRSESPWDHSTLHFGKKDDPWHNMMSFGKKSDPWHNMMSFGKRPDYSWDHNTLHFGKKNDPWHSMMSFGKRSDDFNETEIDKRDDPWHNMMSFGKRSESFQNENPTTEDKRDEPWHNMMSFGKKSDGDFGDHFALHFGKRDEPWHNMMSFGKKSDTPWDHSTLHFGKKDDPWHNMMSFGKKSENSWDHSTLHFGKKDDPWHNMMSFGKRLDGLTEYEEPEDITNPWEDYNAMLFYKKSDPWEHNTLHFGKKSNSSLNPVLSSEKPDIATSNHIQKRSAGAWGDHQTMHFGKKSHAWETPKTMYFEKGLKSQNLDSSISADKKFEWDPQNTMHFGKKSNPWEYHNTMHFGKKRNPWDYHSTMHFGKRQDPWEYHNTMHFGKKRDPWDYHSTMHFGKRSDENSLEEHGKSAQNDMKNEVDKGNIDEKRSKTEKNWPGEGESRISSENGNEVPIKKRSVTSVKSKLKSESSLKNDAENKISNTESSLKSNDNHETRHQSQANKSSFKSIEKPLSVKIDNDYIKAKLGYGFSEVHDGKESVEPNMIDHLSGEKIPEKDKAHSVATGIKSRIIKRSIQNEQTNGDKSENMNTNPREFEEYSKEDFPDTVLHFGKRSVDISGEDEQSPEDPWLDEIEEKRFDNWDNHHTLHFGKKSEPWDSHSTLHFGKKSTPWDSHSTMHFGKRNPWDYYNTLHFGKKFDPWLGHHQMHFGKRSSDWNHNVMHFGKKSGDWDHSVMHFGKRPSDWDHSVMHFGKRPSDWDHSVMHFGKREELKNHQIKSVYNNEDILDLLSDPEILKNLLQNKMLQGKGEDLEDRELLEDLENLENAVNFHLRDESIPFDEKLNLLKSYLKPILKSILSVGSGEETDTKSSFPVSEEHLNGDRNNNLLDGKSDEVPFSTIPNEDELISNDGEDTDDGNDEERSKWLEYLKNYQDFLKSKRATLGKPEIKRYFVPFQGPKSIVYPHAWFASQIRRSTLPRTTDLARSMEMRMAEKKEDPFNSYMHFGRR